MEEEKRHRGRPQKQESDVCFIGFTQASIQDEYFRMPAIWVNVCAEIDNLAELKVVQYVLRHTWGYQDYEGMKHITIDEFVNGRKYTGDRAGERMDFGTGLSDKAVKQGLARAIKHGFLACIVDDTDRARIKKYYALKMAEAEQEQREDDYQGGITNTSEGNIIPPSGEYHSPRSKERTLELTRRNKEIRITHLSENLEETLSIAPPPGRKQKAPAFIQHIITDFSSVYGDSEHIPSNVSQAANIYRSSGMREEQFSETIYAAMDMAKKASVKKLNSRGRPNRVPYFFKCLKQMSRQIADSA